MVAEFLRKSDALKKTVTFSREADVTAKHLNLALTGAGGGFYKTMHSGLSMNQRERAAAKNVAAKYKQAIGAHVSDIEYYMLAANALELAKTIVANNFSKLHFKDHSKLTPLLVHLSRLTNSMRRYVEATKKQHNPSNKRYAELVLNEAFSMLYSDSSKVTKKFKKPVMSNLITSAFAVLSFAENQVSEIPDKAMRAEVADALKTIHNNLVKFSKLREESSRMDKVVRINLGIQICGAVACASLLIAASVGSMGIVPVAIAGAIAAAMLCSVMWRAYAGHKHEKKLAEYHLAYTTEDAIVKLAYAIDSSVNNVFSKVNKKPDNAI